MVTIRKATQADLKDLLLVEKQAFGDDQGDEIVALVRNLLSDPSAKPYLSLLAIENELAVGHILFSKVCIITHGKTVPAAILAPLAVIPGAQGKGIGGKLIQQGLKLLSASGVQLVFVLGYPEYYPRFGFRPAGELGFEAPYPILDKNADAWMIQALGENVLGIVSGKVVCADALMRPEYWCE